MWECIAWRPLATGRLLGWRMEEALSEIRRVSHTYTSPRHLGESLDSFFHGISNLERRLCQILALTGFS